MTSAKIGYGAILRYYNGSGYTVVAERVDISGPSFSREAVDATHMDSPNGWMEFIAGLKDGGEISFEGNHLPADASQNASAGVLSLFVSGALTNWQLVFPDAGATTWTFPGIVTGFEPSLPNADKASLSVTLKLSGEPTLV